MTNTFGLIASELRVPARAWTLWTVSIAALVLLIVAVYPSIRDKHSLDSIYRDLSPAVQTLLGGSDLTSAAGYLSTQLFAFFLPAVVLVFAIGRGAASVAGEEEEHTLDLLLAQPLSRRSLYGQKSGALCIGLGLLTLASWVPVIAADSPAGFDLPIDRLAAACVQMGLLCLALGLAAQAIAAAAGRRVLGVAATTAYTAVSYVIYGLSTTVRPLRYLRPLTLWRWYLGNDPLRHGFGPTELGVLTAVCAVAAGVGMALFARRDLRA